MLLCQNNNGTRKKPLRRAYTLKDVAKEYVKETNSDKESEFVIDVCKEFNKRLIELIVEKGTIVTLNSLGKLMLLKKLTTEDSKGERTNAKLKVDFAESKKQGKVVYYRNEHSQGYFFCYKWLRGTTGAANTFKYLFYPTRPNKKYLANAIKNNKVKVSINI